MRRVLNVAGHVNIGAITAGGGVTAADAEVLRRQTGTRGEQEFTSYIAGFLSELMSATGHLVGRAADATWSEEAYRTWGPDLVIAHHIHRDPRGRAMFAVPDLARAFHMPAANAESVRFMARVMGRWAEVSGIPVTMDVPGLKMRQLYTWRYIDVGTQALIIEWGQGDLDTEALFNAERVRRTADYLVACTLEHFDVPPPPLAAAPVVAAPPARPPSVLADELERLAREVRAIGD